MRKDCKLSRKDAMNHGMWGKLLKDEQDRCEWVNIYFGTNSPG